MLGFSHGSDGEESICSVEDLGLIPGSVRSPGEGNDYPLQYSCLENSMGRCFLTSIEISQEAGQVAWYSHFLKNFPQFVVIHTVKVFGIVNKAEIDVFFQWMLAI